MELGKQTQVERTAAEKVVGFICAIAGIAGGWMGWSSGPPNQSLIPVLQALLDQVNQEFWKTWLINPYARAAIGFAAFAMGAALALLPVSALAFAINRERLLKVPPHSRPPRPFRAAKAWLLILMSSVGGYVGWAGLFPSALDRHWLFVDDVIAKLVVIPPSGIPSLHAAMGAAYVLLFFASIPFILQPGIAGMADLIGVLRAGIGLILPPLNTKAGWLAFGNLSLMGSLAVAGGYLGGNGYLASTYLALMEPIVGGIDSRALYAPENRYVAYAVGIVMGTFVFELIDHFLLSRKKLVKVGLWQRLYECLFSMIVFGALAGWLVPLGIRYANVTALSRFDDLWTMAALGCALGIVICSWSGQFTTYQPKVRSTLQFWSGWYPDLNEYMRWDFYTVPIVSSSSSTNSQHYSTGTATTTTTTTITTTVYNLSGAQLHRVESTPQIRQKIKLALWKRASELFIGGVIAMMVVGAIAFFVGHLVWESPFETWWRIFAQAVWPIGTFIFIMGVITDGESTAHDVLVKHVRGGTGYEYVSEGISWDLFVSRLNSSKRR